MIDNQAKSNEWIPCNERLPEIGQVVLVCQTYSWERFEDGAAVTIGRLKPSENEKGVHWEFQYYKPDFAHKTIIDNDIICPGNEYVAYWQPLPEPYSPK